MNVRRIAFINEKGGTGKTTLAVNTAAFFALKRRLRVLLIDMDTQGHAGKSLGVDGRDPPNVFDWLTDSAPFDSVVRSTSIAGLQVVPAYKQMADFAVALGQAPGAARRLLERLSEPQTQHFDVVVLDAPPSLGLASTNVLVAATEVVVPVAVTYLAMDGCAEMLDTVQKVSKEHDRPDLGINLVIPTLYRKTALADEIIAKLEQYFPGRCAAPVAMNVAIDEAQSHGKTIWEYAPWSRGATVLQHVAEAVEHAGQDEQTDREPAARAHA